MASFKNRFSGFQRVPWTVFDGPRLGSPGTIWLHAEFESNDEVLATMETYFKDLQKTNFSDELKTLENRWVKSIGLKEEYVEK